MKKISVIGGHPAQDAFGRGFVVLCVACLLFYLSFQVQLPVAALYAMHLGGSEVYVGMVNGIFAAAAMVFRPLAGGLTDRVGRRPVMIAGAVLFTACSFMYPLAGSIVALLTLRVLHGIGMGLNPTAATVVVADLAPPSRRGEAMGYFALVSTAGLALGPYVGVEVLQRFGFASAFGVSGALAAGAGLLAWTLPETRPVSVTQAELGHGRGVLTRLFSRPALYPSLILLALCFGYGGVVSFMPLFAERRSLGNPGVFFLVFAITVTLVRSGAGRVADQVGRRLVVVPALALAAAGQCLLAWATSPMWVVAAAVVYGVGFGAGQPALMAMATDRVPPDERGRAMGTFFTAWELGIATGSMLLGLLAARAGFGAMWWVTAALAAAGAVLASRDITRFRG